MIEVRHYGVECRGGPLDGKTVHLGPAELGLEIRISTCEDWPIATAFFEHFYQVVACRGKAGQRMLTADFVKTMSYVLPLTETKAGE